MISPQNRRGTRDIMKTMGKLGKLGRSRWGTFRKNEDPPKLIIEKKNGIWYGIEQWKICYILPWILQLILIGIPQTNR